MKALSIISIIFSLVFTFWFLLFIGSDGKISIEEFSLVGFGFGVWSITFSIIATVSSFMRKGKKSE